MTIPRNLTAGILALVLLAIAGIIGGFGLLGLRQSSSFESSPHLKYQQNKASNLSQNPNRFHNLSFTVNTKGRPMETSSPKDESNDPWKRTVEPLEVTELKVSGGLRSSEGDFFVWEIAEGGGKKSQPRRADDSDIFESADERAKVTLKKFDKSGNLVAKYADFVY
eukprot:CAMPEP_0171461700 /NCGR_PEP_ID=MMETSP0945-20130129/6042_1 /TAXON_ID=109269 /ORGANISM="Vaucheria litorea, Strain CCMP2940" /LENGTH=165 /DNA_ID=CAMNT_0011988097 /DNA_START=68 /DNA_END=566 /DNA_ORIENTATION=-